MSLDSCRNGRFIIFLAVISALLCSCSVPFLSDNDNQDGVPPSNNYVAQTVIERAFKDCAIPDGKGLEVSCVIEESGKIHELMEIVAQEYLTHHGFRVSGESDTLPGIRLRVDTLYVNLIPERSKDAGKIISRSAETLITAVLVDNVSARKVYKGRGVFHDNFAPSMLDAVGTEEPYVICGSGFTDKFKPVLFGVAITLFVWFLYSYRG